MFETDHKQWRTVNNLKTNIVYNSITKNELHSWTVAYWLKMVIMILQQLSFPITISNTNVHETV